ncbi:MAG: hypothetical protein ABIB79_01350 [archaeon]
MYKKRGQIWVETVIYTLIALVMIGLVLTYVEPKIEEIQDKTIIEESVEVMEDMNSIFSEIVQGGAGNKRLVKLGVKKGMFKIDAPADKIIFEVESKHTYSQLDKDISIGNIIAHTDELGGKLYMVYLTLDYKGTYNITFAGGDKLKTISKASNPYNLLISNRGKQGTLNEIDIEIK